MANIQERRNKDGKLISYSIRVHRGRGADGSNSSRGQPPLRYRPHGQKRAQEKRPRLLPRPLKKRVKRALLPTAARSSAHTAIMFLR